MAGICASATPAPSKISIALRLVLISILVFMVRENYRSWYWIGSLRPGKSDIEFYQQVVSRLDGTEHEGRRLDFIVSHPDFILAAAFNPSVIFRNTQSGQLYGPGSTGDGELSLNSNIVTRTRFFYPCDIGHRACDVLVTIGLEGLIRILVHRCFPALEALSGQGDRK